MPIREFVSEYHKAQREQFTGRPGIITVDLDTFTVWVHDGTTPGGNPVNPDDTSITVPLLNNVSIPTTIISYPLHYANGRVNFSATKEGNTDFGVISIYQDGSTPYFVVQGGNTGSSTGITFSVTLTSMVNLQYVTTNGGGTGSITFLLSTF